MTTLSLPGKLREPFRFRLSRRGAIELVLVVAVAIFALGVTLASRFDEGRALRDVPVMAASLSAYPTKLVLEGKLAAFYEHQAERIDTAVYQWAKAERAAQESALVQLIRQHAPFVEDLLPNGSRKHRWTVHAMARTRVNQLSGDAPAWRETAGLCASYAELFGRRGQFNPRLNEEMAQAYTFVLGRTVTARELRVRVPEGGC